MSDLGKLNLTVFGLLFKAQLITLKKGGTFRCLIGICDKNMRYSELHKKHINVDEDIIMHKLRKDGAVRAAWINALLIKR